MKIGDIFDLRDNHTLEFIRDIVKQYGYSHDINEIGSSVQCRTENGQTFEILKFHSSPHFARIVAV